MLLCERGPTGGDRSRKIRGEKADHVGVPLADDDLTRLHDGLFGPVEAVEGAPFRVDRRLGRVAVLGSGPLAGPGEDPSSECDRLARRVEDREDDPAPEGVPQAMLALVG